MDLVLLTAGAGTPSKSQQLGDRLLEATVAALADSSCSAAVTRIEVHTLAVDLAVAVTGGPVSPALAAAQAAVLAADGLIAVTPVYNGSYAGLFKLFFDALDPRVLIGRPVLLAATGGSPRHSLVVEHALLPLFYFFKAEVTPVAVYATGTDITERGALDYRIARAAGAFASRVMVARPRKELPGGAVGEYDDLLRG